MALIMNETNLKNLLKGVLGVAAGWGTAPTNLANITDGDFSTVTGIGSTVAGAAGDVGTITFDLGVRRTVLVFGRVGIYTSANSIYALTEGSDDNVTWRPMAIGTSGIAHANTNNATEVVRELAPQTMNARYVRLRFYVGGAATGSVKVYELAAYGLVV